jgi:hypothetical protein
MKKITSTAELKDAILLLEEKQAAQGQLLKEQFRAAYEGLTPGNIAKNLFSRFSTSTDFKIGITAAGVALATFYLAKSAIVRSTQHPFRKLFGAILQTGASSIISHHPETLKSVGQVVLQHIFRRRERKSVKAG